MKDKLQALKDHLCDLGYEDAVVFDDKAYVDAYIGMSSDGRPVYSYDKMVECLMNLGVGGEDSRDILRETPTEFFARSVCGSVLYDDPEYMWKDDVPETKEKKDENETVSD